MTELETRIGVLEERLNNQIRRIDYVEDHTKEISKISTLLEIQMEMDKEQKVQIKEQSDTLLMINENLTGLNTRLQNIDERVETLEESNRIDLDEFRKTVLLKGVPTIISAIIVAWLLIKLGLQ